MDKLDADYLYKMGQKIKKYRKMRGLTQGELAKAADFKDRSSIAQIENGINDISRDRFIKIANALNVDVSVLLFDQDVKKDHIIVECESVPVLSEITPTTSETVGTVELPSNIDGDYIGYIMDDDSMDPYIQINDILIIKKQPYAALVVGSILKARILHLGIELNLRLGTRRTNRYLSAVLAEPLQHVASVRHVQLLYTAVGLLSLQSLVVLPQANLATTQLLWRIRAEVGHHLLDLVGTRLTGTYYFDGHLT